MREVYPFPPQPHDSEDDEKTQILPGTVSGELPSDWPDAQTVIARRNAVGTEAPPVAFGPGMGLPVPLAPTLAPPAPMPMAMPVGEATKILDVNSMHEWISSAVSVSQFANGTAEVSRPSAPAPDASTFDPEIFALPPEITESIPNDHASVMKLARGMGIALGIVIIVVGALALLKPSLALQIKLAIFPEPITEPVVLAIEVPEGGNEILYGPSLEETWVAQLAAGAAQAMQAGDREEALARYRELHTLVPDNEVYAGFVKTLSQKKGAQ